MDGFYVMIIAVAAIFALEATIKYVADTIRDVKKAKYNNDAR